MNKAHRSNRLIVSVSRGWLKGFSKALRKTATVTLVVCFLQLGSILSQPHSCCAQEAVQEKERFSPILWRELGVPRKRPLDKFRWVSRGDEFRKFLRDYDFIGMDKSRVHELLGDESDRYVLNSGGDSFTNIEVEYQNDKVFRWRFQTLQTPNRGPSWITENVLWVKYDLIPKRLN